MPKLFGGGQFKTENLKKLYLQTDTKYNLKLEGGVIVGMFYQNGGTMAKAERENVKQNCEGKSRDVFAKFMSDNYDWDIHKAKAFTYTKEIFDADAGNDYKDANRWFRGDGNSASQKFRKSPFFDKAYRDPDEDDLGFALSFESPSEESDTPPEESKTQAKQTAKPKNPKIEKKDVGDMYNMAKKKAYESKAGAGEAKAKAKPKPKAKSTPKKKGTPSAVAKKYIKDKPGYGIAIFSKDSKTAKVVKVLEITDDDDAWVQFSKTKSKTMGYTFEPDVVKIPRTQLLENTPGLIDTAQTRAMLKKAKASGAGAPPPPKLATPPTSANPLSPSPLKGRKTAKATKQTSAQSDRKKNALKLTFESFKQLYPNGTQVEYEKHRGVARWVERRYETSPGVETTYYNYKTPSNNPKAPSGNYGIKNKDPRVFKPKKNPWIDPEDGSIFTPDRKVYTPPDAGGAGAGAGGGMPVVASWSGVYEVPTRSVTRGVGTQKGGVRGTQQTQPAPAPAPAPLSAQLRANVPVASGVGGGGAGAPPPPGGGGGPQPPPDPDQTANVLQNLVRRRQARNVVGNARLRRDTREQLRDRQERRRRAEELPTRPQSVRQTTPEDRTYAEPTDRERNIRFNVSEKEKREDVLAAEGEAKEQEEGEKDLTDDKPEISTSGHQRAVSLIAVKYGRDFTYYKNLVETGVLQPPPTSYAQRKTAMLQCLAEYGAIFEIDKFNTDYTMDEAVEIYALKAIYKEVIDEERAWKKALIKMGQRMGVDPNYQTGPPGQLEPGMVIPLNALGEGQNRIMDILQGGPPPPPGAGLGGESKQPDEDDDDDFGDEFFTDEEEGLDEEGNPVPGGDFAPPPVQTPAKRNNKPLIDKQNKLNKQERAELNKFRFDKKTQPRGTATRQRKKKELDPKELKFNTHTRMNPNLLMQLGRVGFPTHNNQAGAQPTFSRIQQRSAPTKKLSFKIF